MNLNHRFSVPGAVAFITGMLAASNAAHTAGSGPTPDKVDKVDKAAFRLPAVPPSPADNTWTQARAELGKQLFFDPRLSGSGQVTCASCHLPERAWSDGLPTAVKFLGPRVPLATPALTNIAFNTIFMWDGRQHNFDQLNVDLQGEMAFINAGATVKPADVVRKLAEVDGYRSAFERAYPGEGVNSRTIGKALAAFQRTLVSRNSAFDRWIAGQADALSPAQVNGYRLFVDSEKGACVLCHQPPNFTDNGFHNIGLKSYGDAVPHPGRGKHLPLKVVHGAFKTPQLRDVALSAPYFHDGSAPSLREAVEHYVRGGDVTTNLSPTFRKANLSPGEVEDLVSFLGALTSPPVPFVYPVLPR